MLLFQQTTKVKNQLLSASGFSLVKFFNSAEKFPVIKNGMSWLTYSCTETLNKRKLHKLKVKFPLKPKRAQRVKKTPQLPKLSKVKKVKKMKMKVNIGVPVVPRMRLMLNDQTKA